MSFKIRKGDSEVSGDFSKLEKLAAELDKSYYVDIGILGESSESPEGDLTLAGIGAVHEFGTDRAGRGNSVVIPERSFIRMPLETGQEAIEDEISKVAEDKIKSLDIEGLFKLIGIAGEARCKEAFESQGFGTWPPNAPSTIEQKGSSKPLIDEGLLKDGITSRVGK